jgi:hypothetical protein
MTMRTGGGEQGPTSEDRAAEARVRALRDEMVRTADWLESGPAVRPREIRERLLPHREVLARRDLSREFEAVRTQLDAMFERLQRLAQTHPDPVPADSLGLPADARFLRDMAGYLAQLLGSEEEPGPGTG